MHTRESRFHPLERSAPPPGRPPALGRASVCINPGARRDRGRRMAVENGRPNGYLSPA